MPPRMKTGRRKSPDLTIRLTPAERARIDAAAERLNERAVSSWVRRLVLDATEDAGADAVRAARVRGAIAELQRQGPRAEGRSNLAAERESARWGERRDREP
ncbi:MAG: hypothetical protein WCC48_00160 [Anaeromyxobacteraceae bacterium]